MAKANKLLFKCFIVFLGIICCIEIPLQVSFAAETAEMATIRPSSQMGDRAQGLVWKGTSIPVYSKNVSGTLRWVARVIVQYSRNDWKLVGAVKKEGGLYTYEIPLKGLTTPAEITAVGPFGNTEKEKFIVFFTPYQKPSKPPTGSVAFAKKNYFFPSLGVSYLKYQETDREDFTEIGLTLKVAWSYLLSSKWDLGANVFYTALPLSSQPETLKARYLGVNGKVGYQLIASDSWRVGLQLGMYFTTMFVSASSSETKLFGYKNLMGPQFFPVLRKLFGRDSLMTYFKFSPVGSGFSLMDFVNREIAGGLGWSHVMSSGKSYSLNLDVANLNLEINQVIIRSNSVSLGFSYSL